ncbi:hypothetical protein K449DRAFT_25734 [Hypoxylon sp. EC38]|nr:hypothetical protein K449DRAFT_25734 [Hypoxylon sp. EC38]
MKNSIKLSVVEGDMIYANDMAVFHARDGFENGGKKRHLLKIYLRDPDQGWGLPSLLGNKWKTVYSPNLQDSERREAWHIHHEAGLEVLQFVNG